MSFGGVKERNFDRGRDYEHNWAFLLWSAFLLCFFFFALVQIGAFVTMWMIAGGEELKCDDGNDVALGYTAWWLDLVGCSLAWFDGHGQRWKILMGLVFLVSGSFPRRYSQKTKTDIMMSMDLTKPVWADQPVETGKEWKEDIDGRMDAGESKNIYYTSTRPADRVCRPALHQVLHDDWWIHNDGWTEKGRWWLMMSILPPHTPTY